MVKGFIVSHVGFGAAGDDTTRHAGAPGTSRIRRPGLARARGTVGALLLCLTLPAAAATRVALVNSCATADADGLLDLALTVLAGDPTIELVERQAIAPVLEEQQHGQCGLIRANQAIQAGRLLGADVFAVVDRSFESRQALGLVVYDVASGVRFWDCPLAGGMGEAAARGVAEAIRSALAKRDDSTRSLLPVCVASVRNVDLPREWESLCGSVGLLVERRLVDSPGITILERQRLAHLNRERDLPVGASSAGLAASLITIEIDLHRDGATDGLTAQALLRDGQGRVAHTVNRATSDRAARALADALSDGILEALRAAPVPSVSDPRREARRFFHEAQFHLENGAREDALRALEAAVALDPLDRTNSLALALELAHTARDLARTADEASASVAVARRALTLDRAVREADARAGRMIWCSCEQRYLMENRIEETLSADYMDEHLRPLAEARGGRLLEDYRALRAEQRDLRMNLVHARAAAQVRDWGTWAAYQATVMNILFGTERFTEDARGWLSDMATIMRGYLKGLQTDGMRVDWSLGPTYTLSYLCWVARPASALPRDWHLAAPERAILRTLYQEMADHVDPVAATYGRIGLQVLATAEQALPTDAALRGYESVKAFARAKIEKPARPGTKGCRPIYLYAAARDAIDFLIADPHTRRSEHHDLFEFMLARKDMDYWTAIVECEGSGIWRYRHYIRFSDGELSHWPPYDMPPLPDEHRRNGLAAIRRVRAAWGSRTYNDVSASYIAHTEGTFDNALVRLRERILRERPHLGKSVAATDWGGPRTLLRARQLTGMRNLAGARLDGDTAVIVAQGQGFHAVRLGLADGATRSLLHVSADRAMTVRHLATGDGRLCVSTDAGLYLGPAAGGDALRLGQSEGLPGDVVEAAVAADGRVFAAVAGGHLVAIKPDERRVELLASCRRRDRRTPLDDLSPAFGVTAMQADPSRSRVLLTVSFPPGTYGHPAQGLWQIDTRSGALTQLVATAFHPVALSPVGADRLLLYYCSLEATDLTDPCPGAWEAAALCDLTTDKFRVIAAQKVRAGEPHLPIPPTAAALPAGARPPLLLSGDWLWFNDTWFGGLARVRLGGSATEPVPPPAPDAYAEWIALAALPGGNQVLAVDREQVWVLQPPDRAGDTP